MTPQKVRKRPVVVQAIEFTGVESAYIVKGWAWVYNAAVEVVTEGAEHRMRYEHEHDRGNGHVLDKAPAFLVIPTLEGDHRADLGDWIVKGVQDEFYPVKAAIFAETYEAVTE